MEQTTCDADLIRVASCARTCPLPYGAGEMPDLARFVERQHADPEGAVQLWARAIQEEDPRPDSFGLLSRLTSRIRRDFSYRPRLQAGIQEPLQTLRTGAGSCRDFAVLMSEAVRSLGFSARFVSGYLYEPPDRAGSPVVGGHTHAWVQVYVPGAGWIDFDPTSGSVGSRNLIRVAVVLDPEEAAPLSGTFIGYPGDFIDMTVSVDVRRIEPAGRTGTAEFPAGRAA